MSTIALLAPQVTVYRGKVWFLDEESVCYSIDVETARDIAIHSRLVKPSTVSESTHFVSFSAIRVRRHTTGTVELPLSLPTLGPKSTCVSYDWLMFIAPLLLEALHMYDMAPTDSFTLFVNDQNEIVRTSCDRRSIPPRQEEEE